VSATITKPMTADELLAMPHDGYRYELVKGVLKRMSPAGDEHGRVGMELAIPLGAHVKKNKLGKLYLAETGFLIKTDPDTVRAPDIAFVRIERIEQGNNTGPGRGASTGCSASAHHHLRGSNLGQAAADADGARAHRAGQRLREWIVAASIKENDVGLALAFEFHLLQDKI